MAFQHKRPHNPLFLKAFLAFLTILAVVACDSSPAPKVVKRHQNNGNNGPGNENPEKPRPNGSYQIFATTNLNLLGSKEVLRIIDIATNLEKAARLDRCQKVQTHTVEPGKKTRITITPDTKCRPSAFGREEILVEKNAENKIVGIELNPDSENRRDLFLEFESVRNAKSKKITTTTLAKENIRITSTDGKKLNFEGTIEINEDSEQTRIRRKDNKQDKEDKTKDRRNRRDNNENEGENKRRYANKSRADKDTDKETDSTETTIEERAPLRDIRTFIKIEFSGTLDITDVQAPALIISKAKSTIEFAEGRDVDPSSFVESDLIFNDEVSSNTKGALTCGLPDGAYLMKQKIHVGEKRADVATNVTIAAGIIKSEATKTVRKPRSCESGFTEIVKSIRELGVTQSSKSLAKTDRYGRLRRDGKSRLDQE